MNLDFSDIKVLVVGDFMIDHYIIGESNRMSPEAPVPVVVPKEEYSIPGGAGNVAMNISSMGSQVTCIGAIGNDIFGKKLRLICGSLKDVHGVKGKDAFNKLDYFMQSNDLVFAKFYAPIYTWSEGHTSILNLFAEID